MRQTADAVAYGKDTSGDGGQNPTVAPMKRNKGGQSMTPAWQVPISVENRIAHYFPRIPDTSVMVRAACGRSFNPGFAAPLTEQDRHCSVCEQRLSARPKP